MRSGFPQGREVGDVGAGPCVCPGRQ